MKSKYLFLVVICTIVLSSCNKDDDALQADLEGTWEFFQEGYMVMGQENLQNYEHAAGCDKDYMVITATTVFDHEFYNNGATCEHDTYSATYTRNNNTITIIDDGDAYVSEIAQLDATTLKITYTDTFEGITATDITVYKRRTN